jgi:hypothetical protein
VFTVAMLAGCGPKPDHNENWYYYWEKDNVIPGLDRAGSPVSRWDWSVEAANQGVYGAAHGPSNGFVLTDLCITEPENDPITVQHKNEAARQWDIGAATTYGIEAAAATMAHEKQHVLNYQQIQGGQPDTDHDGLADSLENVTPYYFIIADSPLGWDTYDLAGVIHPDYEAYGDNEVVARQAEAAGVSAANLDEDWTVGGAQWRH